MQLLRAAGQLKNVSVKVVDYNHKISFINQLNTTSKADIFIGMHGAGLTHLLFLPPWAAVFELYNCDDVACYSDLARLKGVKYFTWNPEKVHLISADSEGRHPGNGEKHKKFANYNFDIPEFTRILKEMITYVRRNPEFQHSRRILKRHLRSKQKEL
ncbi:unnamed protein product [Caenorhabditis angaria]|uniref:EGF domain-specific O-linked N-acetylglucosamine transferase n=1 Tax=Caenorhabditis angaria TaxID=860376 RepID=A0A9P1IWY8_9PELO|nr:unnamed protein product [Caenorhabditis angaria]